MLPVPAGFAPDFSNGQLAATFGTVIIALQLLKQFYPQKFPPLLFSTYFCPPTKEHQTDQ